MRAHDGDGWVECSCGQRHWGRFGAAGLLVSHAGRVLLQHRAPWSHHGDTWGVPGGARRSDEDALTAALREAKEEAGVDADVVTPYVSVLDDHGPWSYTTVLARTDHEFTALATDPESVQLQWVSTDEVPHLPLHPAFRVTWSTLRPLLDRHDVLIVDAANVVGSRPDGWWRDRAGATERLAKSLAQLAPEGLRATALGANGEQLDRVWPQLVLVVEGQAKAVPDVPPVRIVRANGSGDDAIVDEVRRIAPQTHVTVVTADRGLRARVELDHVATIGPGTLLALLDR